MKLFSMCVLLCIALFNGKAFAQSKGITIQGKVTAFDNSLPLEGAGIIVKGTANITGTQADGTFSLTLAEKDSVLVISFAGYKTEEVKITSARDYEIFLKQEGTLSAVQTRKRH